MSDEALVIHHDDRKRPCAISFFHTAKVGTILIALLFGMHFCNVSTRSFVDECSDPESGILLHVGDHEIEVENNFIPFTKIRFIVRIALITNKHDPVLGHVPNIVWLFP